MSVYDASTSRRTQDVIPIEDSVFEKEVETILSRLYDDNGKLKDWNTQQRDLIKQDHLKNGNAHKKSETQDEFLNNPAKDE